MCLFREHLIELAKTIFETHVRDEIYNLLTIDQHLWRVCEQS